MNLIFDLDGTLTDPFLGITASIRHAMNCLGRPAPPPESLNWCIGPPLKESFKRLLGTDDEELALRALALYRERFGTVGLFENSPYPGIANALDLLRRKGHTLFIATAKPGVYAERILSHFKLRTHFTAVFGSELDGTRSDKADLIAYLLRTASLCAPDAMMIGDRHHDVVGARRNGVGAYGVLWGYGSREELESAGAAGCFASPAEMVSRFCG